MTELAPLTRDPHAAALRAGGYAVALLDTARLNPTEAVYEDRVARLMTEISCAGFWRVPILVEATVQAIMDGHHRWTAARRLGLKRVPAVVLAYGDTRLTLTSWNGETYTPDDVIAAARSGRPMPQKSTRHILKPGVRPVRVALAALQH